MSPLDAAFLQLEDSEPGTSLAISSTAVFDGPAPGTVEFTEMLAGRLALIPRYRQKARQVPLDLGPPVWVDDEHFDINYHVRRTALPAPGGDAELSALMARVMSARLDRARPLWEYWLVEGLSGGRFALISKIHHCMVDGVSGTDLYNVVLDPTADPRPPTPDDWHPEHEPSGLRLTAAAVAELGHKPVDLASALVGSLRAPGQLPHRLGEAARGVVALAAGLWPARASSLSGPLSAHRRFAFSRGTVADIIAVRKAFGGTFNDVVLAAVTGGFRDLIRARGEEPTSDMVRSLVPVSVRAPGTEDVRNNQVSMMLALLPVEIAEPVERLTAVTTRLAQLKETHEAEVGAAMVALAATEPFAAVAAPVRMMARLPQRSVVTVTTNVPGPRVPLYLLGRQLREIIPYVPIASNLRIGVAILSYRDRIAFGVTGDYDTSADVEVLARAIESGLHDLAALARKKGKRRS